MLRPSRQHLTLVLRLGRVLGRALLVDPGARDEDDGEDADDDEARRVFLMRQRVVADDASMPVDGNLPTKEAMT